MSNRIDMLTEECCKTLDELRKKVTSHQIAGAHEDLGFFTEKLDYLGFEIKSERRKMAGRVC